MQHFQRNSFENSTHPFWLDKLFDEEFSIEFEHRLFSMPAKYYMEIRIYEIRLQWLCVYVVAMRKASAMMRVT